jgi:hypothetical protein
MEMLERLDNLILSQATKIAHRFQRLTGLTTYFIANIGVGFSSLAIILDIFNYFYPFLLHKTPLFGLIMDILIVFMMIKDSIFLIKANEHVGSNVKPAEIYRALIWGSFLRPFWFGFLILDIISFISFISLFHKYKFAVPSFFGDVGFSLGLTIFYYFVAVEPLPPGKSKIREWIESSTFVPQLIPAKEK